MRYRLVLAGDDVDLEKQVNGFMESGWLPIGAISVIVAGQDRHGESYMQYTQAMTREAEKP